MSYNDEKLCESRDLAVSDCVCHLPPPINWQSRALAAEQERDQLKATNNRLNHRVQAMESKHPERSTLWGSDQTLRLEIVRLHKELVAAHRGAATWSWISWKRIDEIFALRAELQQAREWFLTYLYVPRWNDNHAKDRLALGKANAILERIEKEKTSPH